MATPVLNSAPAVEVTLALFGGTDTEISPSDVPEGLSPDNQDMVFLPGDTSSRPCLRKLFNAPFPGGVSVVYQKSYVQPNNDPLNLYLTSDGKLWVEDVANTPGATTQLGTVPAGLYAQSVSAFGREYIAFSDLLHGQGVPLQYDGSFLDRVTMDGPGAGPSVANSAAPLATLQNTGAGAGVTITSITTTDASGGLFTTATFVTAAPHGMTVGTVISVTGVGAPFNVLTGTSVSQVVNATTFKVVYFHSGFATESGGTVTPQLPSLTRLNNVVTATTAAAHGFQGGWQVQVSAIANSNIGGGIAAISRDNSGVVTVKTTTPHGLAVGAMVAIVGVTNPDTTYNGTFPVASVTGPLTFTYAQGGTATTSGAGTGNVQDIWNVTAFIQSIPSATTFTYQNVGPNNLTSGSGTATIIGQVAGGVHGVVCLFLTRQGYLTRPSPPLQFAATGNQQIAIQNLPLGPANVVARVLGLTGAGGANYFIIPVTPQVSGQIVGTSTVIPDNTTTTALLDFSDNTLFAGLPIDQIGNDLFDQVVLGPVLGFFSFASRLMSWGDWAKIENFLNLGFCGGYLSGILDTPLGWTVTTAGGILVNGGSWTAGMSWQIAGDGSGNARGQITQPAYQDVFGDIILSPSTQYLVRLWAKVSALNLAGNIVVDFFDPSGPTVLASAVLPVNSATVSGGFLQANLSGPTPAVIPAGTLLRVYELGMPAASTVTLGEIEIIFSQNPYRNTLARCSYVLNPEAFAQTTGNLGPADDQSPIQNFSLQKNVGLLHTGEATHEFRDNDFEPGDGNSPWPVDAMTHSVGALSLRACDPGQFGTGDSAEDWDIIASKNGVYLHLGAQFYKVAQEMSRTLGTAPTAVTWDDINWAAQHTIWVKNFVNQRFALIGVPIGAATAPNLVFSFDYREMDTAQQIASALPIHITLTGKMKSSDMTRKWTRWNVKANCAEVLLRPGNVKNLFLGGGSGSTPQPGEQAFGNLYSLDPTLLTDDDYGAMAPYYTTYAFVDHDQEQQLQLGSGRHLYKHISGFIAGVGLVTITPFVNSLSNPLPPTSPRQLRADSDSGSAQASDLEWTTGIRGQRVFFKISVAPLPGTTDVQMKLEKLIVRMMKDPTAVFRSSGI